MGVALRTTVAVQTLRTGSLWPASGDAPCVAVRPGRRNPQARKRRVREKLGSTLADPEQSKPHRALKSVRQRALRLVAFLTAPLGRRSVQACAALRAADPMSLFSPLESLLAPAAVPGYRPRCEFKYQITEAVAEPVARALQPYCAPDPFLANGDPRYTITSLYLDTPGRDLYWATENQHQTRFKVRVRTYGMAADGPVFLEIKRRWGDAQVKSRVQVPASQWQWATEPGGLDKCRAWKLSPKKWQVVEDFAGLVAGWNLEPAVTVRYDRVPLVGRLDPELRVTFDRAIRAYPESNWHLHADDRDYLPVDFPLAFDAPEPRLVLEIKFDTRFPIWLRDLTTRFELRREAFAKYCSSLLRVEADRLRQRTDTRAGRWEG